MRPISLGAVALVSTVAAGPLAAQEDPMALQRCVWACLAANGPNTNPAYHACVADRCTAPETGPAVGGGDPTSIWQAGRTGDGTGYAGIDAPGRAGEAGVYFFCRRGFSYLQIFGLDGGAAPMLFVIDGQVYPLAFTGGPGEEPRADLPHTAPLVQAMMTGGRLEVQTAQGATKMALSLAGSRQALSQVISGC